MRAYGDDSQQNEFASHLEEPSEAMFGAFPNDEKMQKYGNLFFLLQSEPRHIAQLCRLINMADIDNLLQTVMFTIYGNQYESREEHLLLTMFQACSMQRNSQIGADLVIVCSNASIRQHVRLFISPSSEYTCFSHDNDLYQKRAWSKLSTYDFGRAHQ